MLGSGSGGSGWGAVSGGVDRGGWSQSARLRLRRMGGNGGVDMRQDGKRAGARRWGMEAAALLCSVLGGRHAPVLNEAGCGFLWTSGQDRTGQDSTTPLVFTCGRAGCTAHRSFSRRVSTDPAVHCDVDVTLSPLLTPRGSCLPVWRSGAGRQIPCRSARFLPPPLLHLRRCARCLCVSLCPVLTLAPTCQSARRSSRSRREQCARARTGRGGGGCLPPGWDGRR